LDSVIVIPQTNSKLVVITDLEPDDRIAIHILSANFEPDRFAFFGTTVLNTQYKKTLTEQILEEVGLKNIPVYSGEQKSSKDYFPVFQSSLPAINYSNNDSISELTNSIFPSGDSELTNKIYSLLKTSQQNSIAFIVLAPTTELIKAIAKDKSLVSKISAIHIMGEWNIDRASGKLYTTYNWNMDGEASKELLMLKNVKIFLYSSDMIKILQNYNSGSINPQTAPGVWKTIDSLSHRLPSLSHFLSAQFNWNINIAEYLKTKNPGLANTIKSFTEKQFTPADAFVTVGIINPDFIPPHSLIPIKADIDLDNYDLSKGYFVKIYVVPESESKIFLVTKINPDEFEKTLIESLWKLDG
jgi:hypothetical protein